MSDEKTLRDTFAAAALTGIIAASDDSEIKRPQAEFLARQAWLVADAMLRERAATNHDAAPAATAEVATGTGHTTRKPDAWTVEDCDGRIKFEKTTDSYVVAEWLINPNNQPQAGVKVVPLYRDPPQPTLTDAERAFLRRLQPSEYLFASYSTVISPEERKTVFGLLKRLGGDQ